MNFSKISRTCSIILHLLIVLTTGVQIQEINLKNYGFNIAASLNTGFSIKKEVEWILGLSVFIQNVINILSVIYQNLSAQQALLFTPAGVFFSKMHCV